MIPSTRPDTGAAAVPWSKLVLRPDALDAAEQAAAFIAAEARKAIAARGRFLVAFSGGSTPRAMLGALAREQLDWSAVQVFQVDERMVSAGSAECNLAMLQASLVGSGVLKAQNLHAMPVDEADAVAAAARYATLLGRYAGMPPVLDLVQLGLGADGHTASLLPGDAALERADAEVTLSGEYHGRRRMTLSFSAINRARSVVWLVTGAEKSQVLARLGRPGEGDEERLPASRVAADRATLFVDQAAALMTRVREK